MQPAAAFDRLAIAISAFRSDDQVCALLENMFERNVVDAAVIIVVDSLSTGTLKQKILERGWPVHYENANINLGSAGNLARRLELAATFDVDWCFTINHDGMIDRDMIAALVETANNNVKVGAVYPKRKWLDRGQTYLVPHTHIFDMPVHAKSTDIQSDDEVAWDSSNGALYSLDPVRRGVKVWSELWYGWEDLAYGWSLNQSGYKQYICAKAIYLDDYEYQKIDFFGNHLFIARKPAWTTYYVVRNLVLVVKRTGGDYRGWRFLVKRILREIVLTVFFRKEKFRRVNMAFTGLRDGLMGRVGQVHHT